MKTRTQRWIDLTGLNLIRIVIGSYFMAIALGLVSGLAPGAIFANSLNPMAADLIGSTFLFSASMAFMMGFQLRLSALTLCLFVLSTSIVQNIISPEAVMMTAFWTDLTLVCGVLLSYSSLKRHELGKAAVQLRRQRAAAPAKIDTIVRPRRVMPKSAKSGASDMARLKRALQQPATPALAAAETEAPEAAAPATEANSDEPVVVIDFMAKVAAKAAARAEQQRAALETKAYQQPSYAGRASNLALNMDYAEDAEEVSNIFAEA